MVLFLCLLVLRSLPRGLMQVKKRFLISGGGAAETEVAMQLTQWAKTQTGMRGYCIRAYGEGENRQTSRGRGLRSFYFAFFVWS